MLAHFESLRTHYERRRGLRLGIPPNDFEKDKTWVNILIKRAVMSQARLDSALLNKTYAVIDGKFLSTTKALVGTTGRARERSIHPSNVLVINREPRRLLYEAGLAIHHKSLNWRLRLSATTSDATLSVLSHFVILPFLLRRLK